MDYLYLSFKMENRPDEHGVSKLKEQLSRLAAKLVGSCDIAFMEIQGTYELAGVVELSTAAVATAVVAGILAGVAKTSAKTTQRVLKNAGKKLAAMVTPADPAMEVPAGAQVVPFSTDQLKQPLICDMLGGAYAARGVVERMGEKREVVCSVSALVDGQPVTLRVKLPPSDRTEESVKVEALMWHDTQSFQKHYSVARRELAGGRRTKA